MTLWKKIALSDWSTRVAIWRISIGWRKSINSPAWRRRSRNPRNVSSIRLTPWSGFSLPQPLSGHVAHCLAIELVGRSQRKAVDKPDRAWMLVGRRVRQRIGLQFCLVQIAALAFDHERHRL